MADTKISALPAVSSVTTAQELAVNDGGVSRKASAAQIRAYVNTPRAFSTATQGPLAVTDTYLAGSGIVIPTGGMVVGQHYRWWIGVSKSAAGVAAATWSFRLGANGTTADTARVTIGTTAQTAVAAGTVIIVSCLVRVVGATGIITGAINTGPAPFGLGGSGLSSAFDNSNVAGLTLGLSVATGTAAAWTVHSVVGEMLG